MGNFHEILPASKTVKKLLWQYTETPEFPESIYYTLKKLLWQNLCNCKNNSLLHNFVILIFCIKLRKICNRGKFTVGYNLVLCLHLSNWEIYKI